MPCMCGDTYCWSCGPAQGNYKCPICGRWSEDGGCEKPAECEVATQKMYDALAEELEAQRGISE